jgi:glycosyltransferase involved in cell wall biosynthesis
MMDLRNCRILQIANQPGPLHLFMMPLSRRLAERGADVELACMPTGPMWMTLSQCGLPVHALPVGRAAQPWMWVKWYRHLRRFLHQKRYDLIITHTPMISALVRLAARDCGSKVLYFAHGLPFAPEQSPILRFVFRKIEESLARYTDAILVMNRDDVSACEKYRLTRTGRNCFYVPGVGVDTQQYAVPMPADTIADIDREIGLRPGVPMVLFLGRFIAAKRPGDMLELARRLGAKADVVLAGEGPMWDQIKQTAATIGPHVHVLGFTTQTTALLARCSVLVLPSVFREGLPRVLLEAQLAGKPCVAYNVRGSRDVVVDGETGFLIRPTDVMALTAAVERLIDDGELACRLGAAASGRVRREFSLETSLAKTLEAVSGVLNA